MTLDILEKALRKYPNRFQLTMMAVSRAKELNSGEYPLIDKEEEEKPVVGALEELATGIIVPGTRDEMKAIRDARRIVREKALLAEVEEEEAGDEMTLGTASPDDTSKS